MALAAVLNFAKTLIPGAKNIANMAVRGGRSAVSSFRHANGAGIGTRLTSAASAGRTGITRNWAQLGPSGQTAVRNAAIVGGAGVGLHAINNRNT
jgi:hypothetical protein